MIDYAELQSSEKFGESFVEPQAEYLSVASATDDNDCPTGNVIITIGPEAGNEGEGWRGVVLTPEQKKTLISLLKDA